MYLKIFPPIFISQFTTNNLVIMLVKYDYNSIMLNKNEIIITIQNKRQTALYRITITNKN